MTLHEGKVICSAIDLVKAYHQIPVGRDDVPRQNYLRCSSKLSPAFTSQNTAIAHPISGAELHRMVSKEYIFIKDAELACIRQNSLAFNIVNCNIIF